MRTFTSFDDVAAAVGEDLGTSDWLTIDQERVDRFAEATGDHQWIHVDVRAGEGRPVRRHHRARLPHPLAGPAPRRPGLRAGDARAPSSTTASTRSASPPRSASAPASARTVKVAEVADLPAGKQLTLGWAIEIEGEAKPACVAETVVLLLP